jgi:hypothetical protein
MEPMYYIGLDVHKRIVYMIFTGPRSSFIV